MTQNARSMRRLAILCPLVSLLVSSGIVGHEYWRRDHLRQELARSEREIDRLETLVPRSQRAPLSHDHHD